MRTILVVDDRQDDLDLAVRDIGKNYCVLKANGGRAALSLLKRQPVDLLLTDQRMPGMTGIELLETVRREYPDVLRFLATAYPDPPVAADAIHRGQVRRYLVKPWNPKELRTALEQEFEWADLQRGRRRLDAELQKRVETMEALDRTRHEFLSHLGHELKTPLVTGIGYVDLTLKGGLGSINERQARGLAIALRNLHRMTSLVDDMLALVQVTAGHGGLRITSFPLAPMVDQAVADLRARSARTDLRIHVDLPPDLPHILADPYKISRVLANLLSQAGRHAEDRLRIEIEARRISDTLARVLIRDNGAGLPRELRAAALRRTRGASPLPGAEDVGLGLALARLILEAHGSSLHLQSRPGRGTTARFDLPLTPASASRTIHPPDPR